MATPDHPDDEFPMMLTLYGSDGKEVSSRAGADARECAIEAALMLLERRVLHLGERLEITRV